MKMTLKEKFKRLNMLAVGAGMAAGITATGAVSVYAADIPVYQEFVEDAIPSGETVYELSSPDGRLPDGRYGGSYTFTFDGNEERMIVIPEISEEGEYDYRLDCKSINQNGYTIFNGSYNVKVRVDNKGNVIPEIRTLAGNKVEKAAFLGLTFDPNQGIYSNGSRELFNVLTTLDSEFTIIDAPTREGYNFSHWEGSVYHPGDKWLVGGDEEKSKPHKFTAMWIASETTPTSTEHTTNPTDNTISTNADTDNGLSSKKKSNPNTGDNNRMILLISILGASAAAIFITILVTLIKRRKKEN